MTRYYNAQEKKAALELLHIPPTTKRVNVTQAAEILTWRAAQEYPDIAITYTPTAVRKRVKNLDARPALRSDGTPNHRENTYSVTRLFEIEIKPARTNSGKAKAPTNA